jgi:hypothetical protein
LAGDWADIDLEFDVTSTRKLIRLFVDATDLIRGRNGRDVGTLR